MVVKYTIVKKAKAGAEIQPTLRQKKVIDMVANGSSKTSKAKILSAAGYSRAIQRVPSKVFESPIIKKTVKEVVALMEQERLEVIADMVKKRKKANYAVLSNTLRNLNHDIELLDGRPTERPDDGISADEKSQLEAILARNRKK